MGLLYAIFSIFITLIFPKQITDVICYGRHRDRDNIKSKKYKSCRAYAWIYTDSYACIHWYTDYLI